MSPVDPASDLQDALIAALLADPSVTAIVGPRVYDLRAAGPQDAAFPYIALGEASVVFDHADFYHKAETVVTVHCWSRALGFGEVKQLGRAVEAALTNAAVTLPGDRVQSILSLSTNYMRDPDGISAHGALRFRVMTEPQ